MASIFSLTATIEVGDKVSSEDTDTSVFQGMYIDTRTNVDGDIYHISTPIELVCHGDTLRMTASSGAGKRFLFQGRIEYDSRIHRFCKFIADNLVQIPDTVFVKSHLIAVGNLGKDAIVDDTVSQVKTSLAINTGKDETTWLNVSMPSRLQATNGRRTPAGVLYEYGRKGTRIGLQGSLIVNPMKNGDGYWVDFRARNVMLLGGRENVEETAPAPTTSTRKKGKAVAAPSDFDAF